MSILRRLGLAVALMMTLAMHARGERAAVSDSEMQQGLLEMLARFSEYMVGIWQPCQEPNGVGEACGAFRANSALQSNEDGVRTNADLSMVCAFLVRYAQGRVGLPAGITWAQLDSMAIRSLRFAYSTHKAVRLNRCADGRYWGSTSAKDRQWESSLWAMSVAYSAFFQWQRLTPDERDCVHRLLRAECQYELERDVPTGYEGDTKAEENGWEACVLAAALGLFPDDEQAPQWFERLRLFAINSYSHPADATDTTVVDPDYDGQRVCDLYRGANLYDDYTLQNHNYFHTSYQNVVIQELGEAALALALMQQDPQQRQPILSAELPSPRWHTRALTHNCQPVMDHVLKWLAQPDGELAMPNGNDWSMWLYDQLTSYTTMACLLGDRDALMLERQAYAQIRRRQLTTPDGSWLLRSDIGPRRMGVQAHRVMMTWLMHEQWPTAQLRPTSWRRFARRHREARVVTRQHIVRSLTKRAFSCFSFSHGLRSYTGYIAPNSDPNLVVPYKVHNTGNIIGFYEIEGRRTNARLVRQDDFRVEGSEWTASGLLIENDSALERRFSIHSTAEGTLVYTDTVRALTDLTGVSDKTGLLAISTDPFTATERTLRHADGAVSVSGDTLTTLRTPHLSIDGHLTVTVREGGGTMAFADRRNVNSVMTSLLYPCYDARPRPYKNGELVARHHIVYSAN